MLYRVCNQSNTTGTTSGAGTAYPSGALSSPPVYNWVRVTPSLVVCVMFSRSLSVPLFRFLWPWCCLSFFDLRILITLLVSSTLFTDVPCFSILDCHFGFLLCLFIPYNTNNLLCIIYMPWLLRINLSKPTNPKDELV